jgi:hypothetical protein
MNLDSEPLLTPLTRFYSLGFKWLLSADKMSKIMLSMMLSLLSLQYLPRYLNLMALFPLSSLLPDIARMKALSYYEIIAFMLIWEFTTPLIFFPVHAAMDKYAVLSFYLPVYLIFALEEQKKGELMKIMKAFRRFLWDSPSFICSIFAYLILRLSSKTRKKAFAEVSHRLALSLYYKLVSDS